MVLVYFRALSLVTFHSSLVLRSHAVGNVAITKYEGLRGKNKPERASDTDRVFLLLLPSLSGNCVKKKKILILLQNLFFLKPISLKGHITTTYLCCLKASELFGF